MLDVIVENFVTDDMPCGLGFRIVCEKIASGILLPGAVEMIQDTCHNTLIANCPLKYIHDAIKEASKTLIAISQNDLETLLENIL